ncbi:MAG: nitronate monooxygenase [Deltaproteobacteria bacterium]|nr:nitronate monooxygenase [Deltaproteobacteria bacterium]
MTMQWKTRITELLGCEYPLLQGALSRFGYWKFVAAVCETGAHGCLTAAVSRTPERLRNDIRKCREATDKPFSVNISIGNCPHEDKMLDVILDEGIDVVETAVFNADAHGKRIKDAGRKWVHKTATVKHALHAQDQGADAVIIVGLEGIGYKNIHQLPTMVTAVEAARQIRIPLVIAGGLGDARGMLAVLATGADGVMMGTRFMATEECPVPARYKHNMIELSVNDPRLRHRVLAEPDPAEYEEVMKLRDQLPLDRWLPRLEKVMLKDEDWREAYRMWEAPAKYLGTLVSMAVGVIHDIPTCQELVRRIVTEAEALARKHPYPSDLST